MGSAWLNPATPSSCASNNHNDTSGPMTRDGLQSVAKAISTEEPWVRTTPTLLLLGSLPTDTP